MKIITVLQLFFVSLLKGKVISSSSNEIQKDINCTLFVTCDIRTSIEWLTKYRYITSHFIKKFRSWAQLYIFDWSRSKQFVHLEGALMEHFF